VLAGRAHTDCDAPATSRQPRASPEGRPPTAHSFSYALRSWGVALRALMIRTTSPASS
jgi:hypothetical protein